MDLDVGCRDCAAELDHCHGALIVHTDSTLECTEGDCDDVVAHRHRFVIDCCAVAACDCDGQRLHRMSA